MDIFNLAVQGDLLSTFVNMFYVVFALDFVTGLVYIIKGATK